MKILHKSNSESSNYLNEIILRTSKEKLKIHPEISLLFKRNKEIRFDFLNNVKLNSIPTSNIKDERMINLIDSINSFKNSYINSEKSLKKIQIIKNENNGFEKDYNNYKKKIKDDEIISDLKGKYLEKKIKIPNLSKNNLFEPNILISKDKKLKKLIEYNLIERNKNKKSLHYLNKIKKEVDSLRTGNKLKKNNIMEVYMKKIRKKKMNFLYEKKKIDISPRKEIIKSQREISETKKTFNNLLKLDNFLNNEKNEKNNYYLNQQNENYQETSSEKIPALFKNIRKKSIRKLSTISYEEEEKENNNLFLKIFPRKLNDNISYKKKISLKYKSSLEKLYNKISSSDNQLKFNKRIKNFIKKKGLNMSDDVSPKEICKNIDDLKGKIFKNDVILKDIELRKKNHEYLELTNEHNKFIEKEVNFKNIINNSQNKIIEIYSLYDKY
jgi:hypothetical protein